MAIPATIPMMQPGFWSAADGLYHLYFFLQWSTVFSWTNLYPRWAPVADGGLGSPMFNFYPVLQDYLAELFHLAGASPLAALKMTMALAVICCSLFTFLYVRELFGTAAGLVAGTLSVYAPYLLYNLYQSGDFSQTLALPLLPLVFWAFHRLIARPSRRRFGAAALAYGGLLLAHNVTFLVASPFLAAYCLVLLVRYRAGWAQRAMAACGAAVLGLGVSAVYWLPVFADAASVQLTRFHTEPGQDYRQNFVRLTELVSSRVLHAYNGVVFTNRFGPAQMGLVQTALIAAAMAGLALAWRSDGWTRGLGLLFGLATASALFLNTHWSAPLWSIFPGAAFVQQPIRLLSLAGFFGALTVGAGVSRLPRGAQLGLAGPLVLFVGLAGGAGLTNLRYLNMPAHLTLADALAHERVSGGDYLRHFLPVAATTTLDWSPELLPIALGHSPLAVLPGELPPFARVVDQQRTSLRDTVNLQSSRPFTVRMERLYWTGWQATINGQPARVFAEANSGLLQVAIPAGTSHVVVWLGSTLVRQVALALSLVCCLLTLILGWPSQPVPRLALAAGLPLAAVLLPLALVGVGTELGAAPRSIRPLNVQYGPAELTSAQVMQVSPTTIRARLHWGAVPPAGSTVRVLAGSSGHPWAEATGPGSQQEFALTLPVGMPFDAYFVQIDLFDTHGSLLMPTSARRMYMYPLVQHVQIGALFLGSLPAPSLPGTPELRVRVFASATQGAAIPVDLAWTVHAKHQPANPSLHLVDAAGNLWAQNDAPFPLIPPSAFWSSGVSFTDRRELPLPADAPPGAYRLLLAYPDRPSLPAGKLEVAARTTAPPTRALLRLPSIELVSATAASAQQGEAARLRLTWYATGHTAAGRTVRLRLASATGAMAACQVAVGQGWPAGTLATTPVACAVPAAFPPGPARVLIASATGAWLSLPLRLTVHALSRQMTLPPGNLTPADVTAGGVARLVGYQLQSDGAQLRLRLVWQALQTPAADATEFVHALDTAGGIIWQSDRPPGTAGRPTSSWLPGEYLTDEFTLPSASVVSLQIGLYNQATGQRMPMGAEDHFTIAVTSTAKAAHSG